MAKKNKQQNDNTIVRNKKATHDYFLSEKFEAGLVLAGWEVKSLRQKKIQLVDSHVSIHNGEAWLLGAQITPLNTASTHVVADPARSRKLLLHARELAKIFAAIQQQGHTCVCVSMYWKGHLVKCQIALAKGKHEYDKRAVAKEREWNMDKRRAMSHSNR